MDNSTETFTNIPQKTLFRADEVADIFGVDVRTVYRWRDEGKIDGVKPSGKTLRFSRTVVVKFLNSCLTSS